MFIYFKIKNYKSFKESTTFSMVSNSDDFNRSNTFDLDAKTSLIKTVGIFGANASGKSNLISSIGLLKHILLRAQETNSTTKLPTAPFIQTGTPIKPNCEIEIAFSRNSQKYVYNIDFSATQIFKESLTYYPKTHPVTLFSRLKQEVSLGKGFKNLRKDTHKTLPNEPFLRFADRQNNAHAQEILAWFNNNLHILLNNHEYVEQNYRNLTDSLLKRKSGKDRLFKILKVADPTIRDLKVEKHSVTLPKKILDIFEALEQPQKDTKDVVIPMLLHQYDMSTKEDPKYLSINQESSGTQRLYGLAGVILRTLELGGTLFIDELDNKLHPKLTNYIIQLFHNKKSNPNNAQLVTSTHTTHLLEQARLRRDQIWFVEKNENESYAYPLDRFTEAKGKIRSDSSHEKAYLEGRYGSIPIIPEDAFNLRIRKSNATK